jgi:hypothetical protein
MTIELCILMMQPKPNGFHPIVCLKFDNEMKMRRCKVRAKWQSIQDAEIKAKISALVLVIMSAKTSSCWRTGSSIQGRNLLSPVFSFLGVSQYGSSITVLQVGINSEWSMSIRCRSTVGMTLSADAALLNTCKPTHYSP